MFSVFNKTEVCDECIESVDHDIVIHDNFCRITSTQKYKNSLENAVEWEYRYPTNSSPYDLSVEVFDPKTNETRHMKLEVMMKEKAAETYSDAIAEGKSAVLVEKTEGRSVNCMSLGNIPALAEVTIKMSRMEKLKLRRSIEDEELLEMEFFLAAQDHAKDYGQKMLESGFEPREIVTLKGKIRFSSQVDLKSITSTSHENSASFLSIDTEEGEFSTMKPFGQDKEFQLTFLFTKYPTLSCWTEPVGDDMYATMVTFLPQVPTPDEDEAKREIIVIVDCSGSMRRDRIETCRRALQVFMNSMPTTKGTYLNIHRFGTTRTKIFGKCTPMSVKTHGKAMKYIQNEMNANLGGTNIYDVIQEVLKTKVTDGCQRNVFFFGDGEGSRTSDTINLIKNNVKKIGRIFSFGIGSGINPAFLREISTVTSGNAVFFDAQDKDLQAKIIKQLQLSLEPTLKNVKVELEKGDLKPKFSNSSFSNGFCFNREEQTACFLTLREPKDVQISIGSLTGIEMKKAAEKKKKKGRKKRNRKMRRSPASSKRGNRPQGLMDSPGFVPFSASVPVSSFKKEKASFTGFSFEDKEEEEEMKMEREEKPRADLTEKRKAEEERRKLEEKERREARNLQDLLICCDMMGKFKCDQKTASLVGVDLKKVKDENKDELWMTAIVVAFLQLKHTKRRMEWRMIGAKAIKLLKKNKKDSLIDLAKEFLKKE